MPGVPAALPEPVQHYQYVTYNCCRTILSYLECGIVLVLPSSYCNSSAAVLLCVEAVLALLTAQWLTYSF